jgi:hypothetical protein
VEVHGPTIIAQRRRERKRRNSSHFKLINTRIDPTVTEDEPADFEPIDNSAPAETARDPSQQRDTPPQPLVTDPGVTRRYPVRQKSQPLYLRDYCT